MSLEENRINQAVPHNQEPVPEQGKGKNLEDLTVSNTVFEGFKAAPPTPAERAVFDRKKAEMRERRRSTIEQKPWYKKTATRIGAGALVLVAAGATVTGLMLPKGDHTANTPNKDPKATSEPSATNTPEASHTTSAETLPTVDSLELNADLLSDPTKLGAAYAESISNWYNAGGTIDNAKAAIDIGNTHTYGQEIAAKYDPIYEQALFVNDWESRPDLREAIQRATALHASVLELNFDTSSPNINPQDQEPYVRVDKFIDVESLTPSDFGGQETYSMRIKMQNTDNADKNRVGEALTEGDKADNSEHISTVVFTKVGDLLKISDIVPDQS